MSRPRTITRRKMITAMAAAAGGAMIGTSAFGQGISSRNVKPQPRGKPSGRPFLARLTDVAKQAGLTQSLIYGGIDSKSYIIEVVGCGVAFVDYDNDGWMDLLVLSGTRLEGAPPGASRRRNRCRPTIRRTNGTTETIPNVTADQLVTIREGAGIIHKQRFR